MTTTPTDTTAPAPGVTALDADLIAALNAATAAIKAAYRPLRALPPMQPYVPWREHADAAYTRAMTEAQVISRAVAALRDILDDVDYIAVRRRVWADDAWDFFRHYPEADAVRVRLEAE